MMLSLTAALLLLALPHCTRADEHNHVVSCCTNLSDCELDVVYCNDVYMYSVQPIH